MPGRVKSHPKKSGANESFNAQLQGWARARQPTSVRLLLRRRLTQDDHSLATGSNANATSLSAGHLCAIPLTLDVLTLYAQRL